MGTPVSQAGSFNRRQALFLLSGLAGGLALHGCTSSAPSATSASDQPVSASLGMVTWIGYAPIYVAKAKGFYEEFGLNLDLKVFNSGAEAIAAFTAGQVNGLSLVPSEAVTLAANDKDFRVIYVVDTSNGGDGILARNSIKTIADLKGQSIAVETGGVSHFFLLEVLAEAGLSESDVTLINLTPDAAAVAYQAGKADVAVTYAPFLFTANDAQPDGRILYDSSQLKSPTAIADLIVFDTQFIQTTPKALEAFVKANLKGLELLNSNPTEALPIAAKELGLTPEELQEQLKGVKLSDIQANVEMLSNPSSNLYVLTPLESMSSFLKAQGQISDAPDLSDKLDPQFVLAAQDS
jgi:NitT/TauT family transport system substrate-binding protein